MLETLRKFGLGYCDFTSQLWNITALLRVVALRIDRRSHSIPRFVVILNIACFSCYIFTYQICLMSFVYEVCWKTGDLLAGILMMSLSMNSLVGITKLILYLYQDKVRQMMHDFVTYDQLPFASSTAPLLATTMRTVKKRAMIVWVTLMANACIYNLQPVWMPSQHLLFDDHVRFGLKYILGSTSYAFALIIIFISVFYICFVVANITGFLIITTGYSEGRMLALGQEIRELWSDALQYYRDNFDTKYTEDFLNEDATKELNKYIKRRLSFIVKCHAMSISLVNQIGGIFRGAIAAEFVFLIAALIMDLLGGLEQTFIILPFALMQVSMDCYIGQKLIDSSMFFEESVYECKWENFDVSNMKTVLLIFKMSQKSLILSAGGVATLSFECLMSLYKSIYSAYTTLRSTME